MATSKVYISPLGQSTGGAMTMAYSLDEDALLAVSQNLYSDKNWADFVHAKTVDGVTVFFLGVQRYKYEEALQHCTPSQMTFIEFIKSQAAG